MRPPTRWRTAPQQRTHTRVISAGATLPRPRAVCLTWVSPIPIALRLQLVNLTGLTPRAPPRFWPMGRPSTRFILGVWTAHMWLTRAAGAHLCLLQPSFASGAAIPRCSVPGRFLPRHSRRLLEHSWIAQVGWLAWLQAAGRQGWSAVAVGRRRRLAQLSRYHSLALPAEAPLDHSFRYPRIRSLSVPLSATTWATTYRFMTLLIL